jgi:hypothetical protein
MDIPISDSLFHDDDLERVEVRLEHRHVELLKTLASRKEISFDQTLRYLLNVAARHVSIPSNEECTTTTERDRETVFEQFQSIADRIQRLQEKSESSEPRDVEDILKQLADKYGDARASSGDSGASNESTGDTSERASSGAPSMFDIANETNEDLE